MNSKRPRPAESAAGEVAAVPLKPKHQLRARNCNSSSHNAAAGHVRGAGTSGAKARDAPLLSHIATIAAPETGEELASHHRELVSTGGHIGVWSTDSAQMETAPIDHATKAHDAAEVSMYTPACCCESAARSCYKYTSYAPPTFSSAHAFALPLHVSCSHTHTHQLDAYRASYREYRKGAAEGTKTGSSGAHLAAKNDLPPAVAAANAAVTGGGIVDAAATVAALARRMAPPLWVPRGGPQEELNFDAYRASYRSFRTGAAMGAAGEVTDHGVDSEEVMTKEGKTVAAQRLVFCDNKLLNMASSFVRAVEQSGVKGIEHVDPKSLVDRELRSSDAAAMQRELAMQVRWGEGGGVVCECARACRERGRERVRSTHATLLSPTTSPLPPPLPLPLPRYAALG